MSRSSIVSAQISSLHRRALRLEWLTILWNVVEAVVAIGSGAVARSTALVAFGIDSVIEVSSAVVLLWRLLKTGPDASPEQHEQADRRALLFVGITFFLLAAYVVVDGILALASREPPHPSPIGILLALASLVAMPTLGIVKQRTGSQMGSKALQADAKETWLCAYLSFSLLTGLALNAWLGWWWSDPVAGFAMAPFMVWQGTSAIHEARETNGSKRAA
jgi:divalent metal cation (Fe/Co/Zn/Cd) transporter